MDSQLDLRPSPIAGRWYPADPHELATSVDGYLNAAHLPDLAGEVIGVIAPHAGHIYSGPVAGYAFSVLRGVHPDLVAVVSPMHSLAPHPVLSSAHAAYQTPLGSIPVDQQALDELDAGLQEALGFRLVRLRRDPEHSLEIELPFLQRTLGTDFSLLPVMLRDSGTRVAHGVGQVLARVLGGRRCLLVASTDLSHYYSQQVASVLDNEMLSRIEAFDPEGVLQAEEDGVGFACGRGAVAAVLWAARALGGTHVKLLHYATSGDVTGDYHQVVGYGAAAIIRATPQASGS